MAFNILKHISNYNTITINEDLHSLLHKFWELEEVPSSIDRSLTPDEQDCEDHFRKTHTRDQHGRYIVKLPFKQNANLLGDSKRTATRLIQRLNKRFEMDSTYAKMYSEFLAEYLQLQHMRLLSSSQFESPTAYYLPHHGVLKEDRITTKLRVVFNGSSKTTSGFSLNDLLHVGPKLQNNLFDVLIWFRLRCYVFSSDIEKMYRQINVHKDDWQFQRILWLDETNHLITYELTTVTYGLGCAPFLALRTISQLIKDEGEQYPLAVPVLNFGRYVDDLFGGADSIEQAQTVVQQIRQLCMAGGFHLQKWASNHPEVLSSIPHHDLIPMASIPIQENLIVNSLGLSWQPTTDTFKFSSKEELTKSPTKRTILSTIAKLFDPLGLLSPVTIGAKILMQKIWTLRLDWDDPIPPKTAETWKLFVKGLQDLPALEFPRWLGLKSNQTFELHGFSDASPHAYAAVVFCRSISDNGTSNTHLICSKAKVAPLKRMTIPRMELAGAALVTKLVKHLLNLLDGDNVPIYLWTDSTVAYTWITNHPSRWKDFVHNRVCYIQDSLPQAQWRFVSGLENPADLATRGLTPIQLSTKGSWWTGPSWLSEPPHCWPQRPNAIEPGAALEERPIKMVTTTCVNTSECWDLLRRYSSLRRLLKITSICQRAIKRFKKVPNSSLTQPITTTDIQTAKRFWVTIVQGLAYHHEIKLISSGKSLPSSHFLARLTPFIDANGILRVGGRLQAASLTMENKHPAILPKDSPFTNLVIADAHIRTLHGGTQLTLCTIREEFWIFGGRAPVRSFILKCIQCTRFRRKRAQQLMGQLPKERVTPSRPFLNSGIDYAGPFSLKTWRGRNARTYKSYIALFVCLSTSAVHLELVTDYTAEAFIAAYKRFSGRRGICSTLWSDCGTNFKGAEAALQRLFTEATEESQQLASLLAKDGTQWRFNPPSAPHFGGKWEAGVKSVKHHLDRVIGEALLTYEEMNTLLIQIEAILNSRPLTPCSDDPEDLNVLTPGHFLMGCAPTLIPEPSLTDVRISRLSRWQLIRQMIDGFWTRWSKECLQRYHAISKWKERVPSISEGSMVLIVDERYPPAKWPLGRVIKIHPGKDGLVRVATVKTLTSTLTRPIVKLCPLPIPIDTM